MRYLLLSLVLFAIPAHADTYFVSGTGVFTGNNVCSGRPCSESVGFSFDLSYEAVSNYEGFHGVTYLAQITNLNESSSGDIGTTSGFVQPIAVVQNPEPATPPGTCAFTGGDNYIQLLGTAFEEVDIDLCDDAEHTPVVPSVIVADIFRCGSAACTNDFIQGGFPDGFPDNPGLIENLSVIDTPEPGTFGLLLVGLFGVWGIRRKLAPEVRAAVPNS